MLIYSAYADGVLAAAAVVAQADRIISKGRRGSDLCAAIRTVARGGQSRFAAAATLAGRHDQQAFREEEQTIFGMLLAGIELSEIADTLDLSAAGLHSRLVAMLGTLEAPHFEHRVGGRRRRRDVNV